MEEVLTSKATRCREMDQWGSGQDHIDMGRLYRVDLDKVINSSRVELEREEQETEGGD